MRKIKKGSTDRSAIIRIIDSTDGSPETGVVYNTSGIDLWYRREGAAVTSITEASLSALTDAHSDGGIIHIGNGYYRLDLPDAAWATGANHVMIGGTVTGMIVIGQEIQLVNYDPEDGVRLGLTALPNAAADAAGGLPISDAGGLDLDAKLAHTEEVTAARMGALTDWINGGRLDLILDAIAGDVVNLDGAAMRGTDNAALAANWTATRAGYIDLINTYIDATISSRLATAGYTAPDNTNIGNIITAINHGTYGLNALLTAIGTRLATSGYTAPDNATIAAIAAYLDTEIAAILEDTGTTIPGLIAALNNLSSAQAQSAAAAALTAYDPPTKAELDAAVAPLATAANLAIVDGIVDNILLDTAELQTDWHDGGRLDLLLDGASAPTAAAIRAEIDANSTQLAAIVADTAEIQAELADGGRTDLLIDSLHTKVDVIDDFLDTEVAAILAIAQKIDTMLELDDVVYKFTADALEDSPTGTGGFTATDRAHLDAILADTGTDGVKIADVETGLTFPHAMQALVALTGYLTLSGTTLTAGNAAGTKARITWELDSGNRLTPTFNWD